MTRQELDAALARLGLDVPEKERDEIAGAAHLVEDMVARLRPVGGRDVADHRQMLERGAQVLPQCEDIDAACAQIAHRCDQIGLLGILAPIPGDTKSLKIILYALGFMGVSFEEIESDAYIAVRDVACIVNIQRCENEYRRAVHQSPPCTKGDGLV